MSLLRKTSTGFAKTVFKIAVYIILGLTLFYGCSYAYGYGQKVFSSKGMESKPGTDIKVTIKNGTTVKKLGTILEDYGLIEDDFIFYLQSIAFEYKKVIPGTYKLNTSMSGEEIITALSSGTQVEGETDQTEKSTESDEKKDKDSKSDEKSKDK